MEAVLVPVTILVRQIPGVASNRFLAVFTGVRVKTLVAFHTVGVFLS